MITCRHSCDLVFLDIHVVHTAILPSLTMTVYCVLVGGLLQETHWLTLADANPTTHRLPFMQQLPVKSKIFIVINLDFTVFVHTGAVFSLRIAESIDYSAFFIDKVFTKSQPVKVIFSLTVWWIGSDILVTLLSASPCTVFATTQWLLILIMVTVVQTRYLAVTGCSQQWLFGGTKI